MTSDPDPVVLTFPTKGPGPATWDLTESLYVELCTLFPAVDDVLGECQGVLAWVKGDPRKQKLAADMQSFLTACLRKAKDRQAAPRAPVELAPARGKQGRSVSALRDGAHREKPGDRPPSTPSRDAYADAYWKAKAEGKSISQATEIATDAMRAANEATISRGRA